MLKIFLLAFLGNLLDAQLTTGNTATAAQYLPYDARWASNFGGLANLQNVIDESDNNGMLLNQNLKPGQFLVFNGDFATVAGKDATPVFQMDESDMPTAMLPNGQLVPVPKPNQDGDVNFQPGFGLPNLLNPVMNTNGQIPAAPGLPGISQQFPLFTTDNAGDLFGFMGYSCLTGDCGDMQDVMRMQALSGLFNQGTAGAAATTGGTTAGTTAGTTTGATTAGQTTGTTTGQTGTSGATTGATTTTANTGAGTVTPAAQTGPTAAQQFNTAMMMMGGQNPLNDEDTNRLPFARNFLKTLPGGELLANYGKIGDTIYGESDAFIMGPNGPMFNMENVDRRLQKAQPSVGAAIQQHNNYSAQKPSVVEDPFFWAFLITLTILITGVSIMVVKSRKPAALEDVLMEQNYSSHV